MAQHQIPRFQESVDSLCHFCHKPGHTRLQCFRYQKARSRLGWPINQSNLNQNQDDVTNHASPPYVPASVAAMSKTKPMLPDQPPMTRLPGRRPPTGKQRPTPPANVIKFTRGPSQIWAATRQRSQTPPDTSVNHPTPGETFQSETKTKTKTIWIPNIDSPEVTKHNVPPKPFVLHWTIQCRLEQEDQEQAIVDRPEEARPKTPTMDPIKPPRRHTSPQKFTGTFSPMRWNQSNDDSITLTPNSFPATNPNFTHSRKKSVHWPNQPNTEKPDLDTLHMPLTNRQGGQYPDPLFMPQGTAFSRPT